jgi:hypothetical protein
MPHIFDNIELSLLPELRQTMGLPRRLIKSDGAMDKATAIRFRKALAQELRQQLTIGLPNTSDREALLQLAEHLRAGKLRVRHESPHPFASRDAAFPVACRACPHSFSLCRYHGLINVFN